MPTTDKGFWDTTFKKWVVAAAKCATEDEFVNQHCLVIQGRQGKFKSTFVKKLLPEPLKKYYSHGYFDPNHPDGWLKLSRCLIINLDELDAISKDKEAALKSLITKDDANGRELYTEHSRDRYRYASFIGSINDPEFLSDHTGSRRFIVNSVPEGEVIDIDYQEDISDEIDMIWSQALHLAESGFETNYTQDEIEIINNRNRAYSHTNIYTEYIQDNYEIVSLEEYEEYKQAKRENKINVRPVQKIKPGELIKQMKDEGWPVDGSATKAGHALARLGFNKVRRSYLAYHKPGTIRASFYDREQGGRDEG